VTAAPLKIAIAGALGRMGQVMTAAVAADPALALVARFDRPELEGEGLVTVDQALAACDVVIDFTLPAASVALAETAAAAGVRMVVGPTGFTDEQIAAIRRSAAKVAIVRAGNFSLG
jgi:4-hydroxy-tetrahydrodipicolinate reductase